MDILYVCQDGRDLCMRMWCKGFAWVYRLRKDPLDPIDGGTKVALAYRRVTDPDRAAKEEKARKQAEAAAAKAAERSNKKAGAWAGLPSR